MCVQTYVGSWTFQKIKYVRFCYYLTSIQKLSFWFMAGTCFKVMLVALFQGMHVSPVKHSYAWLPRKCDYWTDRWTDTQTDTRQSHSYVPLFCRQNNKPNRTMCGPLPLYMYSTDKSSIRYPVYILLCYTYNLKVLHIL